jgi:hypothetical protein
MAFIDYDSVGNPFFNVTHRVSNRGDWDDLYAVQFMLELIYTFDPKLSKSKPIKGPVSVVRPGAADTPILIAHFQKTILKRAKPQGYLDQAVGKTKEKSTIWHLNQYTTMYLSSVGAPFVDAISYLKVRWPPLAAKLISRKEKTERQVEYSL